MDNTVPPRALSNSDARTIRQAKAAIDLVLTGAIRNLETNFGPNDNPDRSLAIDALLLHSRELVEEFSTAHEQGERETERTLEETLISENAPAD